MKTTGDDTTREHFRSLAIALNAWIKRLLEARDFEGAWRLRAELEWLSRRAGLAR